MNEVEDAIAMEEGEGEDVALDADLSRLIAAAAPSEDAMDVDEEAGPSSKPASRRSPQKSADALLKPVYMLKLVHDIRPVYNVKGVFERRSWSSREPRPI